MLLAGKIIEEHNEINSTCNDKYKHTPNHLSLLELVESAIANAKVKADASNSYLDEQDLFVSSAYVDEGATLKRFQPRAQGRAFQILKRTSHITIVLATPDEADAASVAPAGKTKAGKK